MNERSGGESERNLAVIEILYVTSELAGNVECDKDMQSSLADPDAGRFCLKKKVECGSGEGSSRTTSVSD